ncbi:MAG: tRNA uridine-5-carboxymethylaminomethyl(34) synthesis GTPase MnmE [Rhodospirillaceae bacterium]|jgi:tRNA modification GTPase|nr:tRNA uridine-5-carboxymethylaminomethyl(34) synthesis GTPase MnmE [Rhodospirillaceae bacterium]MBT3886151.1 tRNA uridine-5-carboxymethylaminomethyl(34) synthesis GTPase MnmE [Rhodospirillaceae bacterium]MBT4118222.1 tRNA uridine-5-carboxymethylaminomethyl(34) synthesis GTPase MnmE [Rhodospirillaceae bacterium]MBT4673065.1 tRNA uridine-5-carboxymethylaminomethyl(34) synthesis GTPase MnmE [Rhodospirillaceae bacterium]MBT4721333.1 tRNA uridine-5-carboxymethylaminomethyl(34) synthesis GTPase Mnm
MNSQTIFALASGGGKAGVAVYRVSGSNAKDAYRALTGTDLPAARRAQRVRITGGGDTGLIDHGLALWFPAPNSFTGEDVAEFHLHGGRAVHGVMLDALAAQPEMRPAEPGEFTRRAFENGKMDLTEAEGLADLVEAETAAQRTQALRQMDGGLSLVYDRWRDALLAVIAKFEAEIDFSDEDLPGGLRAEVSEAVASLDAELARHLDDHRGQRLRDGVSIAILGPPNAGKSSLLNQLANRDLAIVSARAGTTRDVIETHLDLAGYPVVLADTAGLRDAEDELEDEGVRRALARADGAHIKILVFDGAFWPVLDRHTLEQWDEDAVVVVNKDDLGPDLSLDTALPGKPMLLGLSAKTGAGIDALLTILADKVSDQCAGDGSPALSRMRHRLALQECRDALQRFQGAAMVELAAEDLRLAARAMGRITGRVDVEDILDRIFSEFCIGK